MSSTHDVPKRNVAVALMAHPDDAEMTCAGTLVRLSRSGWEIHIATVTAGDCGSQSLGPEETATMRVEEGTRAAGLAGATFHCLGEPDGRVVYDRQSLQKTIDLFRRITPNLVITMPMSDYHSDHEMTGRLGRAASFVYAAPNASDVPLGDGATVPRVYYCDGLGGRDRMGDLIEPTTFVDISDQLELKAEMLACHQSQRDWLRSHNGIDNYIESMRQHSVERGRQCGVDAAEAFVQHRGHGHPADDLLSEMFGPGHTR